MIIYSVQCHVQKEHAKAWETFFTDKHLADVVNTGCFTGYSFRKEIGDSEEEVLYVSEYYCDSREELERYNQEYAAQLKNDVIVRFEGKFRVARKVFEVVGESELRL